MRGKRRVVVGCVARCHPDSCLCPPRCSLLASAAARARGEPDAHELILAGLPIIDDSATELDVPLRVVFARSFFDSPLFRVERALLHLVGQGVATSNAESRDSDDGF